nr:MAG TPA: hypothetical protein [Caudoviricetes sp.]
MISLIYSALFCSKLGTNPLQTYCMILSETL